MLKAVIFDDEYIVLDVVRTIIDWERWGLTLVGTATNGIDALDMIKEHKPDIILTDIRMPGLNGLTLIEKLNELVPTAQCVIISGFDEIEYYKKAIQLDVVDYLEKPITVERIEKCLDKMLKKIKRRYEFEDLKRKWNDSQNLIAEKKVLDILNQNVFVEEKWDEVIGIKTDEVTAVTVGLFHSNEKSYRDIAQVVTLSKSISNTKVLLVTNGSMQIIIWLQRGDSNQMSDIFVKLGELNILIGIGSTYSDPREIKNSYLQAQDAVRMGKFLKDCGIIQFDELNFNNRLPDTLTALEQDIIFSIRSADSEGVSRLVQKFLKDIKHTNLSPDVVNQECLKLIYLGLEVVKETGVEYRWKEKHLIPHKEIEKLNTFDDIEKWLQNRFNEMLDWMKQLRNKQKHVSVQTACEYIEQNFSKEISLEEVASNVKMNPSYFSILFKEEMGITYIKYVTKIRIERAKQMLKEGRNISEVSEEVGYFNHRYFSELFKKTTGLTPGQFKKQLKSTFK